MEITVEELNRLYTELQQAERGSRRLIGRVPQAQVESARSAYNEALGNAPEVNAAIHILQRDHGKI